MDAEHFDTLTRSLSADHSRRGLARRLSGLLLSSPLIVLGLPETEAKRKRKKKKKKKSGDGGPPGSPPPASSLPTGGCPSGQTPCDGACLLSSQCCDNGDCAISGQVCTADRQCACPAAFSEVCGGACVAACDAAFQTRAPGSACRCCTRNGYGDGGNRATCCSGNSTAGVCVGRSIGTPCAFHEQCERENCVDGACSYCGRRWDFCEEPGLTSCPSGGGCLTDVEGTTRCGIPEDSNEGDCGWCTSNFDCDQGQRPGAFCAVDSGPNCGCATGQTFCARPA